MINEIFEKINKHETQIIKCKKKILKYFDLSEDRYHHDFCKSFHFWKKDDEKIYCGLIVNDLNIDPIEYKFAIRNSNFVEKEDFSIAFLFDADNDECFFMILDNSKRIK